MSFRSKGNARALLPFGLDYSDVLTSNYEIETAKIVLPVNSPLTKAEELEAKQSIAFAKLVLDGPFFTGNSTDTKEDHRQFSDGIERHSDKYKKVKKVGRTIEEHPYQLEFFPEELYSVMGITNKKKRRLALSQYKADGGLKDYAVSENGTEASALVEKLKSMADDLDVIEADNKDEEEDLEDDFEDEFEDDEDDDYNAEKYFDDGNDDFADNGDDEAAF